MSFLDGIKSTLNTAFDYTTSVVSSAATTLSAGVMNRQEVADNLRTLYRASPDRASPDSAYQWIIDHASTANPEHKAGIENFFATVNVQNRGPSISFGNKLLHKMFLGDSAPANYQQLEELLVLMHNSRLYDVVSDGNRYAEAVSAYLDREKLRALTTYIENVRQQIQPAPRPAHEVTQVVAEQMGRNSPVPMNQPSLAGKKVEEFSDEEMLANLAASMATEVVAAPSKQVSQRLHPRPIDLNFSNSAGSFTEAELFFSSPPPAYAAAGRQNSQLLSPTRSQSDDEVNDSMDGLMGHEQNRERLGLDDIYVDEALPPVQEDFGDNVIDKVKTEKEINGDFEKIEEAPAFALDKTHLQAVFGGFLGTPAKGWKEFARVISFIALTIITGTIAGWVALACLAFDAYSQRKVEELKKDSDVMMLLKVVDEEEDLDAEYKAKHLPPSYDTVMASAVYMNDENDGIPIYASDSHTVTGYVHISRGGSFEEGKFPED